MSNTPLNQNLKDQTTDNLLKWIAAIAAIATSVLVGALFLYFLFFHSLSISSNPSDWGPFGDFIGGLTNPIISFFSLVALLLTLALQSKQLDAAREELKTAQSAAHEQAEQLKRESRKADVYRVIQVLEARLESLYREPVYLARDGGLERWELYLLFSHATPEVLRYVPPLHELGPLVHRTEYLSTKATLTQLHITLVKLSMQLTMLVSIDNADEFTFFYEPTLAYFSGKLEAVGYLPEADAQSIRLGQEMRQRIRESRNTAHTSPPFSTPR